MLVLLPVTSAELWFKYQLTSQESLMISGCAQGSDN